MRLGTTCSGGNPFLELNSTFYRIFEARRPPRVLGEKPFILLLMVVTQVLRLFERRDTTLVSCVELKASFGLYPRSWKYDFDSGRLSRFLEKRTETMDRILERCARLRNDRVRAHAKVQPDRPFPGV